MAILKTCRHYGLQGVRLSNICLFVKKTQWSICIIWCATGDTFGVRPQGDNRRLMTFYIPAFVSIVAINVDDYLA